jgi:hypothetical protein
MSQLGLPLKPVLSAGATDGGDPEADGSVLRAVKDFCEDAKV